VADINIMNRHRTQQVCSMPTDTSTPLTFKQKCTHAPHTCTHTHTLLNHYTYKHTHSLS